MDRHHLRILLGWLRNVRGGEGWPRCQRTWKRGPPGEPGKAVSQRPVGTLHAVSSEPRKDPTPEKERQAASSRLERGSRYACQEIPWHARAIRMRLSWSHQHWTIGHRRVLHAGQTGPTWIRHEELRREYHVVHGQRGLRL